jgi:hypothetical protein
MSRERLKLDASGNYLLTPIGELHKKLMDMELPDELYCAYRPHLKVLLKAMGRQPDNIQMGGRVLHWLSSTSSMTVTMEETPF